MILRPVGAPARGWFVGAGASLSRCRRVLLLLLLSLPPVGAVAAVSVNPYGWTIVTPSEDSRVVYVSSSQGNDANDGLSPGSPKATIAAGNELIRDGFPDHLLLRRGDVFEADGATLYRWKNGRSASEPVVLSWYGESGPRPVIKVPDGLIDHNGQTRNYQAFIGLDIYKSNSDPGSPDFANVSSAEGMRFVGGGANLLIEDCRFRFVGIVVQSYDTGRYTDIRIRRNIILDAWVHGSFTNGGARIQGLYMSEVDGYLIEENFFDHNGWSEVVPNAGANMFNHNAYIQYDNLAGGVMRGNIFARGAAHGLQARSGGVVERNLFVLNAVSVNVGGVAAPTYPEVHDFPNAVLDNVVINGRTMHPTDWEFPRTAAVWAISVPGFISDVLVDDNIVANRVNDASNAAFEGYENMNFGSNRSYQWDPTFDSVDAAWPHPDDDLGDYYASVGGSDSTNDYLNWLRERPPQQLEWEMTAYAAINYIRAGFNRPPVTGYYGYEGNPMPVVTIEVTDANAAEPGNTAEFRVTATPSPESPIAVGLSISGLAINGMDYATIPATVTIGTEGVATIPVAPIDDSIPEVPESVILTLQEGEGYLVGASDTAVATIADNDSAGLSIIRISASDEDAGEPANHGAFSVTATPPPSHPIQVDIEVSGTAESGKDFHKLKKKVKIDRSGEASIEVQVREDALIEPTETVVVTLKPNKKYLVDPEAASAVVSIADDTPELSIVASDPAASESGDPGQFGLIAEPAPRSPVDVNITVGGSATNGADYVSVPASVRVGPSGTATIDVDVIDDSVHEGNESVTVTLAPGPHYTIGTPSSAEVVIDDNEDDLPSVWTSSDVGNVPFAGTVSHQSGTFTVEGAGADIWGGADQFHFVHQAASGDCEIVARVVSIENTSTDAKAGVMIRASLDANSAHALMEIIPNNAAEFIYRSESAPNSGYSPGGAATAPLWVRVVRSGDTFTAYRSADGATWIQVGSRTIAMPAEVRIGLAVTSNTSSQLCTAVFDSVAVTP